MRQVFGGRKHQAPAQPLFCFLRIYYVKNIKKIDFGFLDFIFILGPMGQKDVQVWKGSFFPKPMLGEAPFLRGLWQSGPGLIMDLH